MLGVLQSILSGLVATKGMAEENELGELLLEQFAHGDSPELDVVEEVV